MTKAARQIPRPADEGAGHRDDTLGGSVYRRGRTRAIRAQFVDEKASAMIESAWPRI